MKINFLNIAIQDLEEIIEYYNTQGEGLGYEFASEIEKSINRITQFPNAWTPLSGKIRNS